MTTTQNEVMETLRRAADKFANGKARFENAVNKVGLSSPMIEGYQRMVSEHMGKFLAEFVKRANTQAIYDVTTNFPTEIISGLGDNRADEVVQEAAMHALAAVIEWDCEKARELAVELLHDVNFHDAAECLEQFHAGTWDDRRDDRDQT